MPSFYDDNHRQLQDRFDSRALADTLEVATVQPLIDDAAKTFRAERAFFFLSTVNDSGHPTVSHKGGAPGSYGSSTRPRSRSPATTATACSCRWATSPATVAPVFSSSTSTPPTASVPTPTLSSSTTVRWSTSYPGADIVVVATVTETFINCPCYITKQASSEPAPHVPDANGEAPLAAWKKIDLLRDVLPKRFQNLADDAGGP